MRHSNLRGVATCLGGYPSTHGTNRSKVAENFLYFFSVHAGAMYPNLGTGTTSSRLFPEENIATKQD